MKTRILSEMDKIREEIIALGEEILKNPETGYFEEKTSALIRSVFDKYGIEYTFPHAITGVKAKIGQGRPNIAIIGEMDSVKCDGKNSHKCGHNAQIASMLGSAIAIKKSGVMNSLDGTITFFAVPAEEFIELDKRAELKQKGKISGFGGKQQLIAEGAFDDVDIAIMLHAKPNEENTKIYTRGYNLGFVAKNITFQGKAVHASEPWGGTNALNAAALFILGIHSNRETFKDEERIRIHPIITKGGDVVNSVPDEVCIETYIRGATLEAIKKGAEAVDRAVSGASQMIGTSYKIETVPGYLPLFEDENLSNVIEDVAYKLLGENSVIQGEAITGSTDMGDLSQLIPVIQPSIGGFTGNLHAKDFHITDAETAYIKASKLLSLTALYLLENGAEKANEIIEKFKPTLDKQKYLNYLKGE
ncbi:MAG: amidohydrolase [Clostridia bacterium]|nr:amidohydrolase [Clostridia bacterium]